MQTVIDGMQELNKIGIGTRFYISHNLPIPESHNFVVSSALQDGVERIFLIEEDHYIEPKAFVALATSEYDLAILQYNDKNGSPHGIVHYNEVGEILWSGVGALCVKRKVFEDLGEPYFRTDHIYRNIKKHISNDKSVTEFEEVPPKEVWNDETNKFDEKRDHYKYGGLDVDFYTRVRKLGYKIIMLPEYKAHHFRLVKLGEPQNNNGLHDIVEV